MRVPRAAILGLAFGWIGLTAQATADVWDVASSFNDDSSATQNTVSHGGIQVHDLGVRPGPVADEDWYSATTEAYSSYEVIVEGMTGDLSPITLSLQRVNSLGTVLNTANNLPGGIGKTVKWENATGAPALDSYIRVRGAACGTNCANADQYTIRFFETTYSVPRFNNAGSQITALILLNTRTLAVLGHAYFWSETGALLANVPFSLNPKQLLVLNTAGVSGLQGVGGSITVTSDGRYGQLSGKAVALEPATGFSFDSPLVPLPL